jgi:hypothetical protein
VFRLVAPRRYSSADIQESHHEANPGLFCTARNRRRRLPGARAAEQTLMPSPQTVHIGDFNAAKKPVLTIDSGDMVTMETASAIIDPAEIDQSGVVPRSAVPEYMRTIFREVDRGPGAHIIAGPIFVKGAMPGDVLEVRIEAIDLAVDLFRHIAPGISRLFPARHQDRP